MADKFELKITGLKETQDALYSYSQQLGDKVVVSALLLGARVFARQAKANAPVRTGRLKRAIFAKKSKIYSAARSDHIIGVLISVRPGKNRYDPKGAYYRGMIENGWTDRGGRKHAGRHYMLRAFNSQRENAVNISVAAIKTGADIVKRKVGLK